MITISADIWSLSGICGVLFDKDGTLIDSHVYWGRIIERRSTAIIDFYNLPTELFADLCLAMGYCIDGKQLRPEGPIALVSRDEVIDAVKTFLQSRQLTTSTDDLSRLFAAEHTAFLAEMFGYIRLLPGVRNMLTDLKRLGIKAAVVTTDSVINTNETLRYLEIDHLFDAVIGKESTTEPKPTGVPAVAALNMLELHAKQTVCIGDAPMDLIMAHNSSLLAGIGVATGQITADSLQDYSPYVVTSLHELLITGNTQETRHVD